MDHVEHLDISLTSDEAEAIRDRVVSGAYASPSDVIRAALQALERDDVEHRERLDAVRQKIDHALNDGRPRLSTSEVRDHLERRYVQAEQEEIQRAR